MWEGGTSIGLKKKDFPENEVKRGGLKGWLG